MHQNQITSSFWCSSAWHKICVTAHFVCTCLLYTVLIFQHSILIKFGIKLLFYLVKHYVCFISYLVDRLAYNKALDVDSTRHRIEPHYVRLTLSLMISIMYEYDTILLKLSDTCDKSYAIIGNTCTYYCEIIQFRGHYILLFVDDGHVRGTWIRGFQLTLTLHLHCNLHYNFKWSVNTHEIHEIK